MRLTVGVRAVRGAKAGAVVLAIVASLLTWSVVDSTSAGAAVDVISGTQTRAGFTVEAGNTLRFDPNVSSTLYVSGNLILKGTLEMKPANPSIVHRLVFTGANEAEFVGGGMTPLATDDGLWVVEGGRLDLQGAAREPWVRLAGGADAGPTTLTLAADPVGWRVGDYLRIAPTGARQYRDHFDWSTITAISGRTVTLASALTLAHPAVSLPDGRTTTAEVLNLSRNVRIEGSPPASFFPRAAGANPNGRAHVFVNNNTPVRHTIDYVWFRYMGPRKYDATSRQSRFVMGRYALHFHMGGRNNVGTVVRGAVVIDTGSHAFVTHLTDGITFDRTIAYGTAETPYWWDVKSNEEPELPNDPSNQIVYDRAIAAGVIADGGTSSHRLAGFSLGCGSGNRVSGSVAVGVKGDVQSSGFFWPEGANSCSNAWTFTSNVAHNNLIDGIFVWQNDSEAHVVTGFTAYRNGGAGIEHGAYRNRFDFRSPVLAGNDLEPGGRHGEVVQHTQSPSGLVLRFTGLNVATSAATSHALDIIDHRNFGPNVAFDRWVVTGPATDAVHIEESTAADHAGRGDFTCWTVRGAELEPSDFMVRSMNPTSTYRVQRRNGTAYRLLPNGTAQTIAPFATCT
jgi:hypothetical protein